MYYNPDRLNIKDWLNDQQVPKGCTKKELEMCGEFNEIYREFGRIRVICYLLMTELDMQDTRTLFYSADKQRKLIGAIRDHLHKYRVNAKYDPIFKRDMASMRRRADYAFKMVCENVRMTEYYPFFQNVGFKNLIEQTHLYCTGEKEGLRLLIKEAKEHIESHPDEIAEHTESIKDEKEAMERHRAKIEEDKRLEKAAARAERDRQRAFDKETKRIRKEQQREERKIERQFERYYK